MYILHTWSMPSISTGFTSANSTNCCSKNIWKKKKTPESFKKQNLNLQAPTTIFLAFPLYLQLFIFLGSKITADGDCSHEIKRCLVLGRKAMTNLDSILKSRDVTLPINVCIVKAMVFFSVVMYECESCTTKKAECWKIDAFESWCWRKLLRVPWTARRSNQSIQKEISPEYSSERFWTWKSNILAT